MEYFSARGAGIRHFYEYQMNYWGQTPERQRRGIVVEIANYVAASPSGAEYFAPDGALRLNVLLLQRCRA